MRFGARTLAIITLILATHQAHARQTPDGRGEAVTTEPTYNGTKARTPLRADQHIQNEGGSDGAGLCVLSSIIANGIYQGVPGLATPGFDEWTKTNKPGKGSELWKAGKRSPGGYYPEKLSALVDRLMPNEKYASHLGRDPKILIRLSESGYPIGVTMNTGRLYNYKPIHHMVSGVHFDANYAAVVDNNDPGKFHWMPMSEFGRRWIDGDNGWAWIWTRRGRTTPKGNPPAELTPILAMTAAAIAALAAIRLDTDRRGITT